VGFLCGFYRVRTFDTFFHLASGRLIAQLGAVPTEDPFSFTLRGAPWLNHSWGYQWLLAHWAQWTGFAGISWLQGGTGATLVGLGLWSVARARGLLIAGSLLAVLPTLAFREVLEARPHSVGFVCLAASLGLLLAQERGEARPLAWLGLVPLYALWATCHGSHVLAPALLASMLLSALLRRARRQAAALGAVLAALLGLGLWLAPRAYLQGGQHFASSFLESHVEEWYPVRFGDLLGFPAGRCFLALWLLSLVGAVVAWRTRPAGVVVTPWALSLLGFFLLFALSSRRMVALMALGALPLWLPYAACALVQLGRLLRVPNRFTPAATGALMLGIGAIPWLWPGPFEAGAGLAAQRVPEAAVTAMQTAGRARRVYNAYNFGGYLMWRGYPPEGVFVDGRAITVYPADFLERFERAYDDMRMFETLVRTHRVDSVLLPSASARVQRLLTYLQASPRWQKTYADDVASVFERSPTDR
jgi:hypothetical protein